MQDSGTDWMWGVSERKNSQVSGTDNWAVSASEPSTGCQEKHWEQRFGAQWEGAGAVHPDGVWGSAVGEGVGREGPSLHHCHVDVCESKSGQGKVEKSIQV